MATVLPPPSKKQRVAAVEKARQQQDIATIPDGLGSVRVQFQDQSTGNSTGGAVSLPVVDTTVKNLELLLNSLQGNVCTLARWSFSFT
jgi:ribosome assembly protein 4